MLGGNPCQGMSYVNDAAIALWRASADVVRMLSVLLLYLLAMRAARPVAAAGLAACRT